MDDIDIRMIVAFHKDDTMPDPLSLSTIASTMLSPSSRLEYVLSSLILFIINAHR